MPSLKGFSEAVSSKEIQYVSRIELDADAEADLSRKLESLRNLTWNGRMARVNHVIVSVKYFVPCQDVNNFAFANAGQYETVTGMVLRVDTEVGKEITIQTETTKIVIGFDDILECYHENIYANQDAYYFFDEVQYAQDWDKWLKIIYETIKSNT